MDRLVSGEAVELDVPLARLGSRAVAFLVDLVVQLTVLMALVLIQSVGLGLLAGTGYPVDMALVIVVLVLVPIILTFLVFPIGMEMLTQGRSLGKLTLGLRVVRDDGGPIRFRHALVRGLTGAALEWPGLLPLASWLVCIATMLINKDGRRIGDLAAGTIVIHERSPAAWGWFPIMPPALRRWAGTLDLSDLDDRLALATRHYLARYRQLREPMRTRIGTSLAAEVAAHISPPPPPGAPPLACLAAVLAERHGRAKRQLAARRAITARTFARRS